MRDILMLISCRILFSYTIPISLFVTMEIIKFVLVGTCSFCYLLLLLRHYVPLL